MRTNVDLSSPASSKKREEQSAQPLTEKPSLLGAEIILQALIDQGVEVIFGYPGGAVLPIYDALYGQTKLRHILVRHEQAALHAAEGYARSTGKVGVVLVTSGPGATNAVTGLTDAMMDSIPVVCLTGQVATHLIGNDAFQECDTTGITRPCTKHNYLVKDINKLAHVIHEAFYVARTGRPGPVVVDLPKDIQLSKGAYIPPQNIRHKAYAPRYQPDASSIKGAVAAMAQAKRPIFYTGGGVINAGPQASKALKELVDLTGFPCTQTLMGLGALPASHKNFLGMLGMHGTYEANMAMYECDVMIAIGSRFDDRVTGKVSEFSPHSLKIHADIDASSINKNVPIQIPIIGDAGAIIEAMIQEWRTQSYQTDKQALEQWWQQIDEWRGRESLRFTQNKAKNAILKPQYAIKRLAELTAHRDDVFITTEVGQHQMWAAQYIPFEHPNRWMTSGGLGTMGYGLPAAMGVQVAHPEALVIDVAGEASIMMNIQELATLIQFALPVKIFIVNNRWMGMVRQWQQLIHGERYSQSYSESLPDFVKLAESFGAVGLRSENYGDFDDVINEMISIKRPVLVDVQVEQTENCYPMIPAGMPHNHILLGDERDDEKFETSEESRVLL